MTKVIYIKRGKNSTSGNPRFIFINEKGNEFGVVPNALKDVFSKKLKEGYATKVDAMVAYGISDGVELKGYEVAIVRK